jgi:GNAT superfamily N-acetyltransferase
MSIKSTLLNISDQKLFCDFLTICHQIPKCYANVVSRAFLLNLSSEIKMQTWAVLQEDTFGFYIVASITACLVPGRFGIIGGLFWLGTAEKYRSKGYASQLVVDANKWLITNGAVQIFVQSTAGAHSLYKSLGFTQNGSMEFWGYSP